MQSITLEESDHRFRPELRREWSPSDSSTAAPYVISSEDVDEISLSNPVGGGKFGKVYPGLYRGAKVCFKHVTNREGGKMTFLFLLKMFMPIFILHMM